MSVWKKIIDNKLPVALVLEDDVNLINGKLHSDKLRYSFETLSNPNNTDKWDIAYLCHRPRGRPHASQIGGNFSKTMDWHVLFGYAITLKGAELLYNDALPIRKPVDVYIGDLAKRLRIRAIRLKSPICTITYAGSDTEGIH
jgi:GR25 family glycosyltransferase involved in LPS biosynthesis